MPLQPNGSAPYTSVAAAVATLNAWRDRGFGTPVTSDTLVRAGVPESLARRTFQSFVGLELLQEDGMPTPQFADFRVTRGEDEYRSRLQEWLRGLYADVLQYTDPSVDTPDQVAEAFRTYEPAGQRRAMASLLIGLWRYAGLPTAEGQPSPRAPRPRPAQRSTEGSRRGGGGLAQRRAEGPTAADLPPALVGLLKQIPANGWTKDERSSFLRAFEAVLDFAVPIGESEVANGACHGDAEEDGL